MMFHTRHKVFKDHNINQLCDEVFTIKNFLSREELVEVIAELDLVDWDNVEPKGQYTYNQVKSLNKYRPRLEKILEGEELTFRDLNEVIRRPPTAGMAPHTDVINYEVRFRDIEVDEDYPGPKQKIGMSKYAFILYLNDNYTGGEICYPEYGIEYKPEAGEIVIHSPRVVHAVIKVKEGFRYTLSSVIDGFIYVDAEKYKNVEHLENLHELDRSDPLFYYSVDHGPTENKRLQKFIDNYINIGLYSDEPLT